MYVLCVRVTDGFHQPYRVPSSTLSSSLPCRLWSGYQMSIMTLLRREKLWSLTPGEFQGYSSEKQERVTQHRSRNSCERLQKRHRASFPSPRLSEHAGHLQQTVSGVDTTSPVSLGPCGLFRRRQVSFWSPPFASFIIAVFPYMTGVLTIDELWQLRQMISRR